MQLTALLGSSRRWLLRTRRAVESLHAGGLCSIYRGAGLAFAEVRPFQDGDDLRAIDWNVTARMGQPYVKRYVEDRDAAVLIICDLSRSLSFGSDLSSRRETLAELAAFIALVALAQGDRLGLLLFTEQVETFIPPGRGARHVLRILQALLKAKPRGQATRVDRACTFAARILRRRSVIVIFSDFLAPDFTRPLQRLGRHHETIAVRLEDPRLRQIPGTRITYLSDLETNKSRIFDLQPAQVAAFARAAEQRSRDLAALFRAARVDEWLIKHELPALKEFLSHWRRRDRKLSRG